MKNRDRYILKVNEADLLLKIQYEIEHGETCIINALTGEERYCTTDCDTCIRKWLNEES